MKYVKDWDSMLESDGRVCFIAGELYYFTDPEVVFRLGMLQKTEYVIVCICECGEATGETSLFPVQMEASSMLLILPEQFFRWDSFSIDFKGTFILMSRLYLEKLNIPDSLPTYMSVRSQNYYRLTPEMMKAMKTYCKMIQGTLEVNDEALNKRAVAGHLTMACFHGLGYYIHNLSDVKWKTRDEEILEKFLLLVRKHCYSERSVTFYAGKLCITPKYLSAAVKKASNKTAGDWINEYVIQEIKNLIKSTDMTMSEICYEMGFPDPSFFGKFFKRKTGMSPTDYRRQGDNSE